MTLPPQDAAWFYEAQEGAPARFQRLMEGVTAMRTSRPQLKQSGSTLRIEMNLAKTPDETARFRAVRDWLSKLTTDPAVAAERNPSVAALPDPDGEPSSWRR